MRRAALANWSRLPNHNPPRFYTAWTQNGHHRRGYRTDKDFMRYPPDNIGSVPMAVQAIPSVDIGSQRQGKRAKHP